LCIRAGVLKLLESVIEIIFKHLISQILNFKHLIGQFEKKFLKFLFKSTNQLLEFQILTNQMIVRNISISISASRSFLSTIPENSKD